MIHLYFNDHSSWRVYCLVFIDESATDALEEVNYLLSIITTEDVNVNVSF